MVNITVVQEMMSRNCEAVKPVSWLADWNERDTNCWLQFGVQFNSKAPREVRKLFESLQLGDQDQEPSQILWVPRPPDEKSVQASLQPAVSLQRSNDEVRGGAKPDSQEGEEEPGQVG